MTDAATRVRRPRSVLLSLSPRIPCGCSAPRTQSRNGAPALAHPFVVTDCRRRACLVKKVQREPFPIAKRNFTD